MLLHDSLVDHLYCGDGGMYLRVAQKYYPVVLQPYSVVTRWVMILYWRTQAGRCYCVVLCHRPALKHQMRQLRCLLRLNSGIQ